MWCLFLLRLTQLAGKSYYTSSLGAQLYFFSLKSAAVGQALSGCDNSRLRNEGRCDRLYCVINAFDAKQDLELSGKMSTTFCHSHKGMASALMILHRLGLDGVGPVDNRPSSN